jgi:Big-like domain-containing protein
MKNSRESAIDIHPVRKSDGTLAVCLAVTLAGFCACGKSPIAPIRNAAPTVTVAFDGASTCTPRPGGSCTLAVVAQANDPDGDSLQYSWSGCASGTSARTTCTVERVGPVVASVEVRDDHGHAVSGAVTGEGSPLPNAAPTVTVTFEGASVCTQEGSRPCTLTVVARASDPDGDPLQFVWSGCASGTSSRATCTVERVGKVIASVDVSDGHGHTVTGTVSGEGLPIPNAPPSVTVVFQGASTCTPQPGRACSLDVLAQASDPDGDPLQYVWSGCASGTSPRATCTVDRPGQSTALVEISDDHGHTVRGAVSGDGTNNPPGVQIGYITVFPSGDIELLGNITDPDEGFLCGRQYCVAATASGACGSARLDCTCLAGLEVDVARTAASGTCTVTFSLKDSWGQLGAPSISFDINNPRVPGTSSNGTPANTSVRPGGGR